MKYEKLLAYDNDYSMQQRVKRLLPFIKRNEKIYLNYVCTFKNQYNGKTDIQRRYAMFQTGIKDTEWNQARESLIKLGVLNSIGAKTELAHCIRRALKLTSAGHCDHTFKNDYNNYGE